MPRRRLRTGLIPALVSGFVNQQFLNASDDRRQQQSMELLNARNRQRGLSDLLKFSSAQLDRFSALRTFGETLTPDQQAREAKLKAMQSSVLAQLQSQVFGGGDRQGGMTTPQQPKSDSFFKPHQPVGASDDYFEERSARARTRPSGGSKELDAQSIANLVEADNRKYAQLKSSGRQAVGSQAKPNVPHGTVSIVDPLPVPGRIPPNIKIDQSGEGPTKIGIGVKQSAPRLTVPSRENHLPELDAARKALLELGIVEGQAQTPENDFARLRGRRKLTPIGSILGAILPDALKSRELQALTTGREQFERNAPARRAQRQEVADLESQIADETNAGLLLHEIGQTSPFKGARKAPARQPATSTPDAPVRRVSTAEGGAGLNDVQRIADLVAAEDREFAKVRGSGDLQPQSVPAVPQEVAQADTPVQAEQPKPEIKNISTADDAIAVLGEDDPAVKNFMLSQTSEGRQGESTTETKTLSFKGVGSKSKSTTTTTKRNPGLDSDNLLRAARKKAGLGNPNLKERLLFRRENGSLDDKGVKSLSRIFNSEFIAEANKRLQEARKNNGGKPVSAEQKAQIRNDTAIDLSQRFGGFVSDEHNEFVDGNKEALKKNLNFSQKFIDGLAVEGFASQEDFFALPESERSKVATRIAERMGLFKEDEEKSGRKLKTVRPLMIDGQGELVATFEDPDDPKGFSVERRPLGKTVGTLQAQKANDLTPTSFKTEVFKRIDAMERGLNRISRIRQKVQRMRQDGTLERAVGFFGGVNRFMASFLDKAQSLSHRAKQTAIRPENDAEVLEDFKSQLSTGFQQAGAEAQSLAVDLGEATYILARRLSGTGVLSDRDIQEAQNIINKNSGTLLEASLLREENLLKEDLLFESKMLKARGLSFPIVGGSAQGGGGGRNSGQKNNSAVQGAVDRLGLPTPSN